MTNRSATLLAAVGGLSGVTDIAGAQAVTAGQGRMGVPPTPGIQSPAVPMHPGLCYANCDGSTTPPFLNVNDFICFQAKFAAGDTYADCDQDSLPPILSVNDFVCFMVGFAAGCSVP